MSRFLYRAVSASGELSAGDLVGVSTAEVVARLQALDLIPLHVEPADNSRLGALLRGDFGLTPAVGRRAMTPFIRQLATLLRASLPIDRALAILQESAQRHADQALARRLLDRVRGGSGLADAMAEESAFPAFCIAMVRAGEVSGALDGVLERLGQFLARSDAARAKIKSAMIYPSIVLTACVASLVVLFACVVPRFAPFFADSGATLPMTTQMLLAAGELAEAYWWLPGLATLLAGAVITLLLRDPRQRRRWDALVLRLPVLGPLVGKTEIAQFARVLGTLLKSGVALTQSLAIAGGTLRNRMLATAINGVAASVREGKGLADPLARSGVVPTLALRLIRIGEETARLDDMLLEIATVYDEETAQRIERLLAMLGPAITIGLGLVVALVIGSIMLAILSVYELAV
jgi:general secretion pathway protein F